LSDSEVVCERPDGTVERVGCDDLQKVEVVTTGDRHLLERLQVLSGFDNDAVIAAMSSTSARRFLCWERTA
jgi:hypothetical protein